jgi:hypothetical protein
MRSEAAKYVTSPSCVRNKKKKAGASSLLWSYILLASINVRMSSVFQITMQTHEVWNLLTPWRRVFLDKLVIAYLVNKFSMLTRTCRLSLSWARRIQSTSSRTVSPRPIWILCSQQGLRGLFESFRTELITKYTLTFGITRWEATQWFMAAKLTRLTHKITI